MGGRALWSTRVYGNGRVVQDLRRQVTYDIMVNEQRICKYIADFVYTLIHEDGKKEKIVEDAKGVQTTDFVIKKN